MHKGAWLAQSADLRVVSSSPMLGVEVFKKKIFKREAHMKQIMQKSHPGIPIFVF